VVAMKRLRVIFLRVICVFSSAARPGWTRRA
jgi:hypothetical protein